MTNTGPGTPEQQDTPAQPHQAEQSEQKSAPGQPEQPGSPRPPASPQSGQQLPSYPDQQQQLAPHPEGQTRSPRTNTLAIVSLVSAFVVSLVAVITGHIALDQIKRRGESGRGLAIAGLVLGYLGLVATITVVTLAIVFASTFAALVAATTGHVSSSSSQGEPAIPTGRLGAANFDDGYLAVGTGPRTVDVYFDPMCPYCGQFEAANSDLLAGLVADGSSTLRLHPLTFLDRVSQGTNYSTRASAALTCEATVNPDGTLDYLAALYANQPVESSAGLSDGQLVSLAHGASIADCVAAGRYKLWLQLNTQRAFSGPIAGADITAIQGTPTVLVNGAVYPGSITDPGTFAAFVAAH